MRNYFPISEKLFSNLQKFLAISLPVSCILGSFRDKSDLTPIQFFLIGVADIWLFVLHATKMLSNIDIMFLNIVDEVKAIYFTYWVRHHFLFFHLSVSGLRAIAEEWGMEAMGVFAYLEVPKVQLRFRRWGPLKF